MTSEGSPREVLGNAIHQARCLLISFDGSICTLFAGTSVDSVTDRLRAEIKNTGLSMPHRVEAATDPLDILRFAASLGSKLASRVEAQLTELECAAIPTALPTRYCDDVLLACRESGRSAAIISANSSAAIRAYLDLHDLAEQFALVAARTGPDPTILPPSPRLIEQAITALHVRPAECVVIGSAPNDIQAAQAAGVPSIAYVKTSDDAEYQVQAGASTFVYSLADLVLRLRAQAFE